MDPGSLDHQSSLSRNTTSSPTTFFEGSLLSPANILPGGMMTPCTSSGSEGRESSAYIQPHHQHRRRELELLKTKQELESLKRTHEKLVESHSLLMATYVESTKRQRMEDRAPLPSPGSALALHAPNAAPFPPPITQTQGPSRPHRGWKELIERKYSYTMPMKPGVGISARNFCATDWLEKNPEGKTGEFFKYWDHEISPKEKAGYEEKEAVRLAQIQGDREKRGPPPKRAPREVNTIDGVDDDDEDKDHDLDKL